MTIKTTVERTAATLKNYKTATKRPGNQGLPGMMNTGIGVKPKKGGNKEDSPLHMGKVAGVVAKKAGQKAAASGVKKGMSNVSSKVMNDDE